MKNFYGVKNANNIYNHLIDSGYKERMETSKLYKDKSFECKKSTLKAYISYKYNVNTEIAGEVVKMILGE